MCKIWRKCSVPFCWNQTHATKHVCHTEVKILFMLHLCPPCLAEIQLLTCSGVTCPICISFHQRRRSLRWAGVRISIGPHGFHVSRFFPFAAASCFRAPQKGYWWKEAAFGKENVSRFVSSFGLAQKIKCILGVCFYIYVLNFSMIG